MRALGVDFGEKRIGVAVSDPSGLITQTWGIIERTSDRQAAQRVAALAAELGAQVIVVGLPADAGAEEGFQARRTRRFAEQLRQETPLPVTFWDESLSSQDAEALVRARRPRAGRRRLDAVAAAIMLQSYLDGRREG